MTNRGWRSFLWLIYGAIALITIAIYIQQTGALTRDIMYDVFGLTASVMIVVGVLINRPAHPLPWLLIALGQFLLVAGDVMWAWFTHVSNIETPFPSLADGLYLMAYPTMAAGMLVFVHHRSSGKDRNGLIDAACITLSLGILGWIFLMEPYASDPGLTGLEKAISLAYPLANVAILAVLTRLMLSMSGRSTPLMMLVGAFVLQLIADSIYGTQLLLTGTYGQGFSDYLTNGFWLAMYALLGMAALHPSMRDVSKPTKRLSSFGKRSNLVRVGVLASSLLLVPVAQAIQAVRGLDMDVPITLTGEIVLVLLIFARMSGLVSVIETKVSNLTQQDRELRGLMTEREVLTEKLHYQAFHDSLTGVANRLLFADRIDHARAATKRNMVPLSLLFIDLDDFKSVNDEFGHAVGDDLLAAVAGRLSQALRPGDTVGRIGGDEFGVLLVGASDKEAALVSERLLRDLRAPFPIGNHILNVEASVGIVCRVDGDMGSDELLGSADLAMYEAKKRGKGRFEFFDPILQLKVIERQEAGRTFEKALDERELKVHYQPIVGLADGEVIGTEALLRWVDPLRGNIPPLEFLPLAHEMNLMCKVDSFVLETAIAQLSEWLESTPSSDFQMNVNISANMLIEPGFVEEVIGTLKRFGAPSANLVLEITETDLLIDTRRAAEVLGGLKAAGVILALDDFGTGYSSLSHIQRFPIDVLKIDKSFIDELGQPDSDGTKQIMTSVINSMGTSFGMATVAEGVETVEQVDALRKLNCPLGQGYLFARPAPPEELKDLLERGRLDIPVLSSSLLRVPTETGTLVAGLLK